MTIRVGVIGCGYWGPNLIRNVFQLRGAELAMAADLDEKRLEHIAGLYPTVKITTNYRELIESPDVDAVMVATPVATHHRFASEALAAGKHVYVEKPLARSVKEVEDLMRLAEEHGKVLMVGHTFLYTGAVEKMKALVDDGELGELQYIRTMRVNLGLFQKDINVLWDLAPHDLSIILHLTGKLPRFVSASGKGHVSEVEDVASLYLEFEDGLEAYLFNSWLDPHKQRYTTVVGDKKMLVYDDVEPQEKIHIYDRGVEKPAYYDTFGDFAYSYRYGDIVTPMLKNEEPLRVLVRHFVECCETGAAPRTGGDDGLTVVRILEAADRSLAAGGAKVEVSWDGEPLRVVAPSAA